MLAIGGVTHKIGRDVHMNAVLVNWRCNNMYNLGRLGTMGRANTAAEEVGNDSIYTRKF